jgi:hypothetical protein
MSFTTDTITPFTDGRAWAVLDGELRCRRCKLLTNGRHGDRDNVCHCLTEPHHNDECPPAAIMQLDMECEYCGGTSGPDWNVPVCPVCNGNGRHTFDVTVPCPDCLPDQPGWVLSGGNEKKLPDGRWVWFCSCRDRERPFDEPFGTVTKRVSIVPGTVLSIQNESLNQTDTIWDRGDGTFWLIVDDSDGREPPVGLPVHPPPAAKPGMYAVQLQEQTPS